MKKILVLLTVLLFAFAGCQQQEVLDKETITSRDPELQPMEKNTDEVVEEMISVLDGEDYSATVTMESEDETMTTMVMEFDSDNGATRVKMENNGQSLESIETDEFLYTNMMGNWIKLPNSNPSSQDEDFWDAGKINDMIEDSSLKYIGEEECAVGTCKIYEDRISQTNSKIYIDDQNRLHKVEVNAGIGGKTESVYDYDTEVEIEIPEVEEGMSGIPGFDLEALSEITEGME